MNARDMTKGDLFRQITGFAVPVCLGLLFQQLYHLADAVIVGRLLGVNALAGVGSTTGFTFFSLSISTGLGNGFAVSTSHRFGAGDIGEVRRYFGNALLLSGILSLALTVATIAVTDPVLRLTRTPDEIYGFAHDYVVVLFAGMACSIYYNLLAAELRAIGDSRTPLVALVLASVVNVVLDAVMIGVFRMGVAGAALATVVSQLLSALFLFGRMRKSEALQISASELRLSARVSAEQLKTSLPMALQGAVIALGILVVQSAVNAMGTVYVAGCTAGNKLYGVMTAPIEAVCQAMIPVSGQNFGAVVLTRAFGFVGVCLALPLAWIFTSAYLIPAYLYCRRRLPSFSQDGSSA